MKNILVLTDFSKHAIAAEKYALQLAVKIHANLTLYSAYPEPSVAPVSGNIVWPHGKPISPEIICMSNLDARVRELTAELHRSHAGYHPEITQISIAGSVVHGLTQIVAIHNIWLIVMGTKGESFASTIIFGSNVSSVLQQASYPVLIVPKRAALENVKKLAYATDLKSDDREITTWLGEFSESLNAELIVEHISLDMDSTEEVDTINSTRQVLYNTKIRKIQIENIVGKNVDYSLHEIITGDDIGMIAMLYRKHGFFEKLFHVSETHKMIKHTQIPVLVFPYKK